MIPTNFIQIGEQKGYIKILDEGTTIHYILPDKRYKFTDPEEQVRASYYVELIERYQYPETRIDLEFPVPRRTSSDFADLVIFDDDVRKNPYVVIECKKDEISEAGFDQAVEQAFGNCLPLSGHYAAIIAGNTRRFFDVKNFKPLERIQNIIADIPVGYGTVQEWRYKQGDANWDLQVTERDGLIRALEKCHDTLWQGGKLAPTEAFDELSKILFVKIRDEKKPRLKGEPYDFQIKTQERPKSVANRINGLYQEAKAQAPEIFTEDIKVDESRLFSVVNHLQGINLHKTDLDVKGLAFEQFLGSYFKGDMGQYFTPREIVEFMVKMVRLDHEDLILDPASGSGGFLLHAMDYIRKRASEFYTEGTLEYHTYWHDFAEKRLFGIEVNDSIARVAKMNMILHDDGHGNVIGNDALEHFDKLDHQHRGFQKERFDIILTNPPFGAVVKKEEKPYLDNYQLGRRKTQKTEILFLERCFDFLKWKTGKLAIILPDGILNNSSLQYVRDYIEQRFQILAVVSLPQIAFSHYGAGVKPSILFLRKFSEAEYSSYQASINRIATKNEEVYTSRVKALGNEQKLVIDRGCPAQVEVTDLYRLRFQGILENIDALEQQLGKPRTKNVQSLRDRFIRDKDHLSAPQSPNLDPKTARARLREHKTDCKELEQEYKEAFKAAADSDWESEVKAGYKEKIDAVKEELADQNAEDIRQWVEENKNEPIFMAIAERIGYDATGRRDPINNLDMICDEYQRFADESPEFFQVSSDGEDIVFVIFRNEIINNRIDSYYYQPKFKILDQTVENVQFKVFNLGTMISDISSGITPKVEEDHYTDSSGVPFLRVQNVTNQGIDLSDAKFIRRGVHEGILKRSQLKKDDIVFTITGRIGSAAVVPDNFEGNINQHSVRFHLKEALVHESSVFLVFIG